MTAGRRETAEGRQHLLLHATKTKFTDNNCTALQPSLKCSQTRSSEQVSGCCSVLSGCMHCKCDSGGGYWRKRWSRYSTPRARSRHALHSQKARLTNERHPSAQVARRPLCAGVRQRRSLAVVTRSQVRRGHDRRFGVRGRFAGVVPPPTP